MRARLLFSIAMSVEPDILIVDEALATGDAYFVAKCVDHIRNIIQSGATILYVSHNLTQIQELCKRAIFMANGRILREGEPSSVVAAYNEWTFEKESSKLGAAVTADAFQPIGGNGHVRVQAARLLDRDGQPTDGFYSGDIARLELDYASELPPGTAVTFFVGLIREEDGQWVGEINSNYFVGPREDGVQRTQLLLQDRGTIRLTMDPLLLLNGHYHLWVMIFDVRERYCEYRRIAPFFVARRAHVFDRGPVFWQPCVIDAL
jgi:hypothetical protein